jgi:hypothetical protein
MLGYNYSKQGGGEPAGASQQFDTGNVTVLADARASALHDNHGRKALNFPVRYSLAEYAGFMWEHGGYLIRRRRVGFLRTYLMLIKSTGAAALHFVAAGRGKLVYDFTIDDHGIVRSCARGVTLISWDDVIRIRRYRRGYLMVLKRGTLPLPYRCLGKAEVDGMERYAEILKVQAQQARQA